MDEQTQAITTTSTSDVVMSRTMFGGLDELTDEQFETLKRRAAIGFARMKDVQRTLMRPGVHYIVPGVEDPAKIRAMSEKGRVGLSKAGCELLWTMHGLAPGEPITVVDYGDGASAPAMTVRAKVPIHRGDCAGPVIAWGVGMCTTHEDKYRWRDERPACPACGARVLMLSRYEAKGGPFVGARPWWCNKGRGGCGAEFAPNDPAIIGQPTGRAEHPNPLDLANTIIKMAAKRATTDATIKATRSSDLWAPDVEDMDEHAQRRMREQAERAIRDTGAAVLVDDPDAFGDAVERGNAREAARAGSVPAQPAAATPPQPATREPAKPQTAGPLPVCPECGRPSLMVSKYAERSGVFAGRVPFYCLPGRGGCGEKFAPDDARIVGVGAAQSAGRPPARDDSGPASSRQIVAVRSLLVAKFGATGANIDASLRALHVTINGEKRRVGGFDSLTAAEADGVIEAVGGLPDFSPQHDAQPQS